MATHAFIVTTQCVVDIYTVVHAKSFDEARAKAMKRGVDFRDEAPAHLHWNPRRQQQSLDKITKLFELGCERVTP